MSDPEADTPSPLSAQSALPLPVLTGNRGNLAADKAWALSSVPLLRVRYHYRFSDWWRLCFRLHLRILKLVVPFSLFLSSTIWLSDYSRVIRVVLESGHRLRLAVVVLELLMNVFFTGFLLCCLYLAMNLVALSLVHSFRLWQRQRTDQASVTEMHQAGIRDADPLKVTIVNWDRIRTIQLANGDLFFWLGIAKYIHIPRSAFPDRDSAERFYEATLLLHQHESDRIPEAILREFAPTPTEIAPVRLF